MSTNLDGTPRNGGLIRADAITDVERPWMELEGNIGIPSIRDLLADRGLSASTAAALALWLDDQRSRRRTVTAPTASRYRRTLEQVGPPPEGSPKIRAIPGYIKLPRREMASSAA